MAMTFRAFCDLADWENTAYEDPVESFDTSSYNSTENHEKTYVSEANRISDMNLHYNIQIHLPETTNMAVYDAIFQSLKKHLI